MTKYEKALNDYKQSLFIYMYAKDSFLYAHYLQNPETDEELHYAQFNTHFRFIMHSLWIYSVIELYKLIKKNEAFSIYKLLNKLKPGSEYASLNYPNQKISEWETALNKLKPEIEKICLYRDVTYAHSDMLRDEKTAGVIISYEDHTKVMDLLKEILNDIANVAFDAELIPKTPAFESSEFNILKIFAEAEKKRIDELYKNTLNKINKYK